MRPSGRLSLGPDALTTSDIVGATSIQYVQCAWGGVPMFVDGQFAEKPVPVPLSLSLDPVDSHTGYHQGGAVFDIYSVLIEGALQIGTGPKWQDVHTRGPAAELAFLQGLYTNATGMVMRYGSDPANVLSVQPNCATWLGTFSPDGGAGLATDSAAKRLLFNGYNRALRPLRVYDATPYWAYSVQQFRLARGNAANKVEVVLGLTGALVRLRAQALATTDGAAVSVDTAIGIDGISVPTSEVTARQFTAVTAAPTAEYSGYPGMGRHAFWWLEQGAGVDNQTWFGASAAALQTGLLGEFMG